MISFPREIGLKRAICKDKSQFTDYIKNLNRRASCYTSLYSFERTLRNSPWKFDYSSAVLDKAWWDFDSPDDDNTQQALFDSQELVRRLEENGVNKRNIRIVATGRGVHVYQLFNEVFRGREWGNAIQRYETMLGRGLQTLDGVGYPEKITRIPDTYNPKRGRWAVVMKLDNFLSGEPIPNRPTKDNRIYCPLRGEEAIADGFSLSEWVKVHPVDILPQNTLPQDYKVGGANGVPLPDCLNVAIRTSNPPHHVRVALVQHMGENLRWFAHPDSLSPEQTKEVENEIVDFISTLGWRDYNEGITRRGVRTALKYVRTPSCAWFVQRNLCTGKCWRYDGTVKMNEAAAV